MSKRARVSVIMPIHNEEDYSSCSLEFQKKIDDQILEFIFILDRRTDNSEAFFRQCFPKTEIVKKATCGWKNPIAENFQIGFEMSRGEVICTYLCS